MSFAEHLPPTPALSSSLTIIITTSPVRSNPSLALLHETFATFQFGNSSQTTTNFTSCKKIIVCDGFRQKHTDSTSRKHSGTKAAMRSGFVDDEQRENYIKFKANLADRVKSASTAPEDDFYNTTILELQSRHGYGFALKEAVKTVETQFVCVIQHDRTFMRRTPILEVVKAMENDGAVKYVGILMRSNLVYLDQTMKYGKAIFGQMERAIKRPKELLLNSREYNNKSVCEELYGRFPRCGEKYRALREQYRANLTYRKLVETSLVPSGEGEEDGEGEKEKVQSSLIPTLFWSDNIHVAVTAHYRDFVFDEAKKLVARGGFVEDKISQVMVEQVKEKGFEEGFGMFGCYLLDDHAGVAFTGHIDGGSYLTDELKSVAKGFNDIKLEE